MQAPKSLLKPQNWQDFETLCKKLWGEILTFSQKTGSIKSRDFSRNN